MDLNAQIEARSRAFVDDITSILRESVLQALGRGELGFRVPAVTAPRMRAAKAPRSNQLAKGEKRSPMLIEKTQDRLYSAIIEKPGQGIEQIAKRMGCTTRELNLPMKKLIASELVRAEGEKRATKYFQAVV